MNAAPALNFAQYFRWFFDTANVFSQIILVQLVASTVLLACTVFCLDLVCISSREGAPTII